eukprot:TRINITY_DN1401_c0_g1_i8.p2 TRINITY_DN1401_c0_g1~~TRINITY_DN1401_c0_g1_i8.p2  ORF type:complete len:126 (-),score=22.30 TRINITY_DN1401_c0_g1_i8:100-477(-)
MCIRDRYQRRVHGEQIHTLFVDLLRQKTRILILSGALDSVVPPEGTANQLFSLVKKGLLNKITTSKPIFAQDEFVGIVNEYTVEGEQGLQFVVLAHAGQMISRDQPDEVLNLLSKFRIRESLYSA